MKTEEIEQVPSIRNIDDEILSEILKYFKWNWGTNSDKLKANVKEGWVTLEGRLQWNFLKEVTENSVMNMNGVKGVTNNIVIDRY